jgi:hypothetical protein
MDRIRARAPTRGTVDMGRSVPSVPKLLAVLDNRVRVVALAGRLIEAARLRLAR